MTNLQKTALHERHRRLGAKMTDFHGWDMPLYYSSILDEHRAVRQAFGMFDISHMGQVVVTGPGALAMLNELTVSDISQVGESRACYTLMLNERGGIIDDVIIYRIGPKDCLMVINCANRASDVEWLMAHRKPGATVTDISDGRGILAVQGPSASRVLENLLDARVAGLGRFGVAPIRTMGPEACIARTGYTGGDGFELFLPDRHLQRLWDAVVDAGRAVGGLPVGLGARDTLRVEAGLRLYGTDMDAQTTPLEAGLAWTVAINKPAFIGREVLVQQKRDGIRRRFIGFELEQGPIPRTGNELFADEQATQRIGAVTSGTFSSFLNKALGMGYVEPTSATPGSNVTLVVRNHRYTGTQVKLPFWKPEGARPALAAGNAGGAERPNRSP
jgi:aminomethyltransferase